MHIETEEDGSEQRNLYLTLLRDTLSFLLWEESPRPIAESTTGGLRRRLLAGVDTLVRPLGGLVAWQPSVTHQMRREGAFWPSQAHTMIGTYRLDNLRMAVETVIAEGIPGDLIETGVWRGGSCIFMRGILKAYGDQARKVYVADSFAGLPPPEPGKYPADKGDKLHRFSELAIPRSKVEDHFRRYGLLDEQVVFVEGFFEHTLHKLDNESFAIIRLDGDMYSSTIQALEGLYPKLSKGGYCIIDDHALTTCQKAVADFRAAHGITDEIVKIDWTGVYWRKS